MDFICNTLHYITLCNQEMDFCILKSFGFSHRCFNPTYIMSTQTFEREINADQNMVADVTKTMDAIVPFVFMVSSSILLSIVYLIARFCSGGRANPATYRNCGAITIVLGLVIIANSIFLGLPIHYDPDVPGPPQGAGYGPGILGMVWPAFPILFAMIVDVYFLRQHRATIQSALHSITVPRTERTLPSP
jgi:hypothetical protein